MIDFNRPPREKTEYEKQFDELNAEYTRKFGKPYVFDFAGAFMNQDETLADIRRRIAENNPQKEPDYKSGVLY